MTRAPRRVGRSAAVVLGLALAASAALNSNPVTPSAHATASLSLSSLTSFDAHLLARINKVRARHGLVRLTATAGTTDIAHGWSCGMAARHALSHNMGLSNDLETHGSRNWTWYGENVAAQRVGASAGRMFRGYMHSPQHRHNILDPQARFVGIWSKRSGGFRFNTIDFVGAGSYAYSNSYGAPRRTC